MLVVVHIVLTTAINRIPFATFGNTVRAAYIRRTSKPAGIYCMYGIDKHPRYIFPPVVVGVRVSCVCPAVFVPRVVHTFIAAVAVGRHHKAVRIGVSCHHCNFRFVRVCCRVACSISHKREVPVKVNAIVIVSGGSRDACSVVRVCECAIWVGKRRNVYLYIVHKVCNLRVGAVVCQQVIDKSDKEVPARSFIAVHGAAPPEFRLVFVNADIVRNSHVYNRATVNRIADGVHLAQ